MTLWLAAMPPRTLATGSPAAALGGVRVPGPALPDRPRRGPGLPGTLRRSANTDWYNVTLGLAMLGGRFFLLVTVLALAGSLARARIHAATSATLRPSGPTFGALLLGVVLVVGGLTYLPSIMLGPLAELI